MAKRAASPGNDAVYLSVATPDDARELARLMKPRDVWRNLEYDGPPAPMIVRAALRRADLACLFIRRKDDDRVVGFFLLYGFVRPENTVEFDIAITDTSDRRGGLARAAILAFERYMLDEGRCAELWAWIDAANRPCLELVRTCGWPITARTERARRMVDAVVDVVEVRMDPTLLAELRTRRKD